MKRILPAILAFSFLAFPVFSQTKNSPPPWSQYNGPFSGSLSSMTYYGDTIFAGSDNTGVFKSTDHGNTWQQTILELGSASIVYNADTALLICSNNLYSYKGAGKPLKQWGQYIGRITSFAELNGKLFVASTSGIFEYNSKTDKFAQVVKEILDDSGEIFIPNSIREFNGNLICNLYGRGIYKSGDEGRHWEELHIDNNPYAFFTMTSHSGVLYGGTQSLYQTTDGVNWTNITFDLPYASGIYSIGATETRLIVSCVKGTYQRKFSDTTWVKVSENTITGTLNERGRYIGSDEGGVYQWEESSQSFLSTNGGINTASVNGVILFNDRLYAAAERGLHYTNVDNNNWISVPDLAGKYCKAIASVDSLIFVGTAEGLYYSSLSTNEWKKTEVWGMGIWQILSHNGKIYVASDLGLFTSSDGRSWTLMPNSTAPQTQILRVAANDSLLITANLSGMYKFQNDSIGWSRVDFFKGETVESLHIIDGVIYAGKTNSGIHKSTDGGTSWSLSSIPISNWLYMLKRGDNIYAASYNKVYYSADNGDNWDTYSETGTEYINIFCFMEGKNAFYIGTHGKSIWRRPFLSTTTIASSTYEISDSLIYDVDSTTTASQFRSNVTLGYGNSLVIQEGNSPSGRSNTLQGVAAIEWIKVIAEDGKTIKKLRVAKRSLVTGIPDAEIVFGVYPVPSSDKVFLQNTDGITSFKITNAIGQPVHGVSLSGSSVDITSLAHGLYIMSIVTSKNERHIVKFIKE